MSTPTEPTKTPQEVRAELVAANQDYVTRFGAELAAKWGPLGEGKSIIDCYGEFVTKLRADHQADLTAVNVANAGGVADLQNKLAAAEKRASEAESRVTSLNLGEETPVSGGDAKKPPEKAAMGMSSAASAFCAAFELPDNKPASKAS